MKKYVALASVAMAVSFNVFAQEQESTAAKCGAHVWYSLNNVDKQNTWYVQISQDFEKNLTFVDENCNSINNKILLQANSTKKVGMVIGSSTGFNSIYSFTGVKNDKKVNDPVSAGLNLKTFCNVLMAPYGPAQADSFTNNLHNAQCYVIDLMNIYFK